MSRRAVALALCLAPSMVFAQEAPPPTPTPLVSPAVLDALPAQSPALSPATTPPSAAPPAVRPAPRNEGFTAWPVRAHIAMPLGSTLGHDHLQGFSWGFRGVLQAYPTAGFRGIGVGGFAEMLIDAETRSWSSFGAVVTAPVVSWSWGGLRAGGAAGARYRGDADPRGPALSLAATFEFVVPAYLYDLGLGLRADATIDETGVAAVSLLVDVDVAVVIAMLGAAGGFR